MRSELAWDRDPDTACPEVMIERAINFGGFEFIRYVQDKHGMTMFILVLKNSRNLSRKAVNYWCLVLHIDPEETRTFQQPLPIWQPFR